MIKVSCPSCNSPYEVDENRLPADGLRMRCPKCAESFQVHRDGTVAKSGGGASPSASRPPQRKPTQVGLGPKVSPAAPLPTPRTPSAGADPFDEIDLPAPLVDSDFADLPAPKPGAASLDFDPFDLGDVEDLPAPKSSRSPAAHDEPASSGFDPFADMDLPAPYEGPDGGTDLPAPLSSRATSDLDLPAPMARSQTSAASAEVDEVDLPMALTDAELPKPMVGSNVPEPISLDSDLPMAMDEQDLPVARDDFADLESAAPVHAGGPIELDLPEGDDLDLEMEFDSPGAPAPQPPPPIGGMGTPGDVSLSDAPPTLDSAELDLSELGGDDDVVHMPHPGGAPSGVSKAPESPKRRLVVKRPPWLMKAVVVIVLLSVIAGAGLYSGTTKYGLFGIHLVEPFLPGSGDEVSVAQAIEGSELEVSADTYGATKRGLAKLAAARGDAKLNRTLAARSLLHESYFQIRYGQDAESGATADGLRLFLQRRGDEAPRVHVALAADALRNGDSMTTSAELTAAASDDPTDSYVDLVQGEAALKNRDGAAAVEAFGRARAKHESARAHWGLARGHELLRHTEEAQAAAAAALDASPLHAGARVAVASAMIDRGELEEAAILLRAPAGVEPVEGKTLEVARTDKSKALTLLASIEEQGGRLGAAREMYERAIELDSSNSAAAIGAARLVLLEGVYRDALARFQTVLGSPVPPGAELDSTGKPRTVVEAKLGAAEALLAMDKADEAKKILADLDTAEPVNSNVEVWLGKVADALGDTDDAVRHLRNAIKLDGTDVRAYIALAKHYADTKRPSEAVAVLVEAQRSVEITAEVRRLLGRAQLQRGELDDAIEQFELAIAEEPRDSASVFGLAQAYRRKRMFDEAAVALDKVAELDARFPALQLERGRLAEAKGDMDGAIAGYQAALVETPDDIALQSRLGAALVLTGRLEEAETLLRDVLKAQPYSAEAEHYLGRIELARGELEASQRHFGRAARLEPENGTYRMYVGWAALESNEMTPALRELEAAIKLDPNLGDAYWLRARVRIRAGTVRDALVDLERAVELNPNRVDVWAAMGECHYQLGQTKEAVRDFEKAVEGAPENAYWWYRLGRLQLDEGRRPKALTSLLTAVSLADDAPSDHGWLADAHRLIGDIYHAQKKRRDAVVEYGRYLELADRDAIDRTDVEGKLRRISQGLD